MWGQNGIQVWRKIPDQSQVVAAWSGNPVRIPFAQLRNAGYLRGIHLYSPPTLSNAAVTLNAGTFVAAANNQFGAFRQFSRLTLNTQGISNLLDVTGEDVSFLAYVRNGAARQGSGDPGIYGTNALGGAYPYAALNGMSPLSNWGSVNNVAGSANVTLGSHLYLPITEIIRLRNVLAGPNKQPTMADMEVEMGMLTLQNTQQNVQLIAQLNPVYSLGFNSPFQTTGGAVASIPATTFNLDSELYDVPDSPADLPPQFLQAYAVTRQARDIPIAGGRATYNFLPAGMLLRVIYAFYLDGGSAATTGQLVDIGNALNGAASIQFKWGSAVIKIQETVQENIALSSARYDGTPPGILIHDFMSDQTEVDAVNTVTNTSIRTEFSGLDTSAAGPNRLHVIEERLIPVQ